MTRKEEKQAKIRQLRKDRDMLWKRFQILPRKESFSGLYLSGELDRVQKELDILEGNHPSKRYSIEIRVEVLG